MDIDLNLETIVMPARPIAAAEVLGPLTRADIKLLAVKEGRPDDAPIGLVKRLSNRHHALARALAKGMSNWEAGLSAGYDETYVSILRADPTFENLVQFYMDQKTVEHAQFNDVADGLARQAMHLLHDKMETEPEKITVGQAIEIAKFGADRSGNAPATSVNHKHEHTINMANRMQRARQRLESRVIDVTPEKDDAA